MDMVAASGLRFGVLRWHIYWGITVVRKDTGSRNGVLDGGNIVLEPWSGVTSNSLKLKFDVYKLSHGHST